MPFCMILEKYILDYINYFEYKVFIIIWRKDMKYLCVLFICISFVGCAVAPSAVSGFIPGASSDAFLFRSEGQVTDVSPVSLKPMPLKNFETRGVIFVTSSVTLDNNGNIIDGSTITFEMLMREVARLNADDFINLRIDEIHTVTTTEGVVRRMVRDAHGAEHEIEERTTITVPSRIEFKATAIAIKYLPL